MTKLFETWCVHDNSERGLKRYLKLTEKKGGRAAVLDHLGETVRSHYERLDRIADDVSQLGFEGAAAILKEILPTTPRAQSGDLGEILASELTEELLEFEVPVRRMRFKDGREIPMRGDDFIGVNFCADDDSLWLLKGEAKSRGTLNRTTITEAREALQRHEGRCTPMSLLFVANRLLESDNPDEVALGRLIRNEVGRKSLAKIRTPRSIEHASWTETAGPTLNVQGRDRPNGTLNDPRDAYDGNARFRRDFVALQAFVRLRAEHAVARRSARAWRGSSTSRLA